MKPLLFTLFRQMLMIIVNIPFHNKSQILLVDFPCVESLHSLLHLMHINFILVEFHCLFLLFARFLLLDGGVFEHSLLVQLFFLFFFFFEGSCLFFLLSKHFSLGAQSDLLLCCLTVFARRR